nr:uncharacterized protein LOC127349148 isoform X2 [Lolium perenne]
MGRSDLTFMLRGLEKHLKTASQRRGFDKGEKWHDLDVTTWPIVEHIRKPLQTDGASCGLFMLNFMEYWTGDRLSDCITQKRMGAKLHTLSTRINSKANSGHTQDGPANGQGLFQHGCAHGGM